MKVEINGHKFLTAQAFNADIFHDAVQNPVLWRET